MKPRFALSQLMVIIAAIAICLALAATAARLQAGAVLALTVAVLIFAIAGGVRLRGSLRAFCLGFAILGWAYLGAAIESPQARLDLPTTRPLIHLGESVLRIGPAVKGPADIAPMIQWVHNYLLVAHSLLALACGVIGGLLGVVIGAAAAWIAAMPRQAAEVAPSP